MKIILLILLLISPIPGLSQDINSILMQKLIFKKSLFEDEILIVKDGSGYFASYISMNEYVNYHAIAKNNTIYAARYEKNGTLSAEYKIKNRRLIYFFGTVDPEADSIYKYFLVQYSNGIPNRITHYDKNKKKVSTCRFANEEGFSFLMKNIFLYDEFVKWALMKKDPHEHMIRNR